LPIEKLNSVEGEKVWLFKIISLEGRQKLSFIQFISNQQTTECVNNIFLKLQVTIKFSLIPIISSQGRTNVLVFHIVLVQGITINIIIPNHMNAMINQNFH